MGWVRVVTFSSLGFGRMKARSPAVLLEEGTIGGDLNSLVYYRIVRIDLVLDEIELFTVAARRHIYNRPAPISALFLFRRTLLCMMIHVDEIKLLSCNIGNNYYLPVDRFEEGGYTARIRVTRVVVAAAAAICGGRCEVLLPAKARVNRVNRVGDDNRLLTCLV